MRLFFCAIMNLILFDVDVVAFYPLTLTRPVSQLRAGAFTIAEKWLRMDKNLGLRYKTHESLQEKFPYEVANDNLIVQSHVVPDKQFFKAVTNLTNNQALVVEGECVALRIGAEKLTQRPEVNQLEEYLDEDFERLEFDYPVMKLEALTDLFTQAEQLLERDYRFFKFKSGAEVGEYTQVIGKKLLVRKSAKVNACTINTETGPVVIEKNAEVMEGAMLRGPLYIGEGAVVKMGAKIYGPTVIGPYSKVGGEISNSVIAGYSNKGHDGFLGNSIIGEWCNLGADTNTSNLKNNYGEVKRYDFKSQALMASGLQFCGLIMGDHSKSAINTQFNTGTTVGVFANVFTSEFPPKYVPSFSWMGDNATEQFRLEKAFEVALRVMERRGVPFTEADQRLLEYLYNQ